MPVYVVGLTRKIGAKVSSLERVFAASDAIDAISKIPRLLKNVTGNLDVTDVSVWGNSTRKGSSKYDPTLSCNCHGLPLWKCKLDNKVLANRMNLLGE